MQQHDLSPTHGEILRNYTYNARLRRALEVSLRLEITTAVRPARHMDVVELEIRTASLSAKNVVVLRVALSCTGDVLHRNARDDDAIRLVSSWSAIQVVLLDVDAVVRDVGEGDVLVCDTRRAFSITF